MPPHFSAGVNSAGYQQLPYVKYTPALLLRSDCFLVLCRYIVCLTTTSTAASLSILLLRLPNGTAQSTSSCFHSINYTQVIQFSQSLSIKIYHYLQIQIRTNVQDVWPCLLPWLIPHFSLLPSFSSIHQRWSQSFGGKLHENDLSIISNSLAQHVRHIEISCSTLSCADRVVGKAETCELHKSLVTFQGV